MPNAIAANRKPRSTGSLIGVLKRTMERAPTKPIDKIKEDLIKVMITAVINTINAKSAQIGSLLVLQLLMFDINSSKLILQQQLLIC